MQPTLGPYTFALNSDSKRLLEIIICVNETKFHSCQQNAEAHEYLQCTAIKLYQKGTFLTVLKILL